MFLIGGFQKTTLIDYPEKIAALVFTQGCNFRCGYCHNPELLSCHSELDSESKNHDLYFSASEFYSIEKIIEFLKTRCGKLDGVVITGGEPTLQSGLYDFIKQIKELGFLVKLDTNGTNPNILGKLINDSMLDYIAMDIKAPLDKYSEITNTNVNIDNIKKSIKLIMESGIDYEFRTTVIKSQLLFKDFEKIGELINGAKRYYLQKFVSSKIYDNSLEHETSYTDEEFKFICEKLKKFVNTVEFR